MLNNMIFIKTKIACKRSKYKSIVNNKMNKIINWFKNNLIIKLNFYLNQMINNKH